MAKKLQDACLEVSLDALTPEEWDRFYELFNELCETSDPDEREHIKAELAKLAYGC